MRPVEFGIALAWTVAVAVFASTQVMPGGSWSRGMAMPTERAEVGAAALDGKIYVEGAYSGDSVANEAYDPSNDSWQTLAPLPQPRNHVCAAAIGGALYVIGGFDPSNANRPVDTTFAYDPLTDRWASRAPIPTPRGALACVVIGNLIYAVGGASPAGDVRATSNATGWALWQSMTLSTSLGVGPSRATPGPT